MEMDSTESSRRAQIDRALQEHREKPPGTVETFRIPFRGRGVVVEVVELPLELPVLNTHSFRIAPLLADHPERLLVESEPDSSRAQEIVAKLVRASHRSAARLKESLVLDGQDEPGLITRGGKLINANSRCVLLRELAAEGRSAANVIRVAVLPSDATTGEELGLESVLQQQEELKDPYTLVSKLMMIETLRIDAQMSDEQIASSLREKPAMIRDLRSVLVLMHRARHLTTTPLPLSVFVTEQDQRENWLALLRRVREIERVNTRQEADDYIRSWLIAYYAGFDSVHQLRNVEEGWVGRDVLPVLAASGGVAGDVAEAASRAPVGSEEAARDRSGRAADLGLDIFGDAVEVVEPDHTVQRLLDLLAQAAPTTASPDATIRVAGTDAAAEDVFAAVRTGVDEGIRAVRRRNAGKTKLDRPMAQVGAAHTALRLASEAVVDVAGEPGFAARHVELIEALGSLRSRLDQLDVLVSGLAGSTGAGDEDTGPGPGSAGRDS